MIYGLLSLPWWGYIVVALVMTHMTIVSVTLFLHRCQAHRGIDIHPALAHIFRFWLWLTTGMETKAWTAIHRKHHARCESDDDPHSPQVLGIATVLWQGAELYRRESRNTETLEQYGKGTPDDWLERHVYSAHSAAGIFLQLGLMTLLFGLPGLTIWAIQMAWIPFFAAGVINGLGHYWGYRNFECPDASTNLIPWGILIGGEELHNNHHTFGASAKFSCKWWEFDIGWAYICLFSLFGLVKVKKVAPQLTVQPSKQQVDQETLQALVVSRFQVMEHYLKRVVVPVFKQERRKAALASSPTATNLALGRDVKHLLVREQSLIDTTSQQRLCAILEHYSSLEIVHRFRCQLQAIWERTTASQKELLEALQEWCQQAEATGIAVLSEFSLHLKAVVVR